MRQLEESQVSARNLSQVSINKSLDARRSKVISHVASQMLLREKQLDDPETAKKKDPINILVRRSALSEEMKQQTKTKPSDIEVLNEEYNLDIFRVLTQRENRQITRYDTWEKDLSPEEWLEKCKSSSRERHGTCPVYNGEIYVWQPVKVEGYDYEEKRYKVKVMLTGQEKLVTRLALRFDFEDSENFYGRLQECKERRDIVETELRFQELVDVVRDEDVSPMPERMMKDIEKKMQIREDNFNPIHTKETCNRLMNVVKSLYNLAMKKCSIIYNSLDLPTLLRLEKINLPVKFSKIAVPYYGLIYIKKGIKKKFNSSLESERDFVSQSLSLPRMDSMLRPKESFNTSRLNNKSISFNMKLTMNKIRKRERRRLTKPTEKQLGWQTGTNTVGILFSEFQSLCERLKKKPLFQLDLSRLQSPMRSSEFMNMQERRIKVVSTEILNDWRFKTLHDIRLRGKNEIAFDIPRMEDYEVSRAKMVIRKFDLIFHGQLKEFFNNSISKLVSFIEHFTIPTNEKLWKTTEYPLLEIDITYTESDKKKLEKKKKDKKKKKHDNKHKKIRVEKTIFFKPTLEECKAKILSLLEKLVNIANMVIILETEDYNVFLKTVKQAAYPMSADTSEVKEAYEKLTKMIDDCSVGPSELLEKFKKYSFLLNANHRELSKMMEGENVPNLIELRKKLDEFSRSEYEIRTLAIDKVQFALFQIDTSYIKKHLSSRAKKLKEVFLSAINKYCMRTTEDIAKKYTELQNNLEEKPTSKEGYKVLKECLRNVDKRIANLKAQHELVGMHIELLEDHLFKVEKDVYYKFFTIYCYPREIRSKREKGNKNLLNYEEQLRVELEEQKNEFDRELNQYSLDYAEVIKFEDTESAQAQFRAAFELQKNIEKALKKAKDLNDDEELLEMKKTEYSILEKLEKDFKPFCSLIFDADNIKRLMDGWYNNSFITLKPQEIVEKIDNWMEELKSLSEQLEEFKEQGDVALDLQAIVKDFSQHLDVIKYLRSEAMREEDWILINKVIPLDLKFNDETLTLTTLINKGVDRYMEELKEIWERAEKKLELEKSLKRLKEETNKKKFELYNYEKAEITLIRNLDLLLKFVDNQIGTVDMMIASPYINLSLKRACTAWLNRLINLLEVLDELNKCQKIWQYLEPMFSLIAIQLTLKMEHENFCEVTTMLKEETEAMNTDNLIISLLEKERIKEDSIKANEKLEYILKSINDFLEATRKKFPRFYFISDTDLILILSNAVSNPELLQPYFSKCFEGIASLDITYPVQEVTAVKSLEGEKIDLIRVLGLKEGDRKGRVEIWLKDLDKIMHESLKDLCKRSINDYSSIPRTNWIHSWPSQITLLVSQIAWTSAVESALANEKEGTLAEYKENFNNELNELTTLLQGDLERIQRLNLETYLILNIHSKEVLDHLCQRQITSPNDFEWTSQMRYNYNKGEVNVKMMTADIQYGFEYIGNSPRLVITPLTDRCYRVLMTAKEMSQGGALRGPVGTGKTETIKDLAKALGNYCIVFNASEELDYLVVNRFFKGIALAGAWCCFDEFNKIDIEVLSVITSQLLIIQRALVMKQTVFQLSKDEIILNPLCGINITINPTQSEGFNPPHDLKLFFRPFAMSLPDHAYIGEILLYSYGFKKAKELAKKITILLNLCEEQLSVENHYTFEMRTLQTVLRAMKVLKRKLPEESEELLAIKALDDVSFPKLTAKDIEVYEKLINDLFTDIKRPVESQHPIDKAIEGALLADKLQYTKAYAKKCIQIYETTLARNGVIIIGEAFSGKSQAIKTLNKALASMKEVNDKKYEDMIVRALNPKAVDQSQLYGCFDDKGNWYNGIIPEVIIECNETATIDEKWIIFDGPIDNQWMENMNTAFDDTKKLCLPSGSVIKLKPNLIMFFEVDQLKYASPAILSRCGIVFMERRYLNWHVLVKTYISHLPESLTSKVIKTIEEFMNSVLPAAMAFVEKYTKLQVNLSSMHLIKSFLNIFEIFVYDSRLETYKLPAELDRRVPSFGLFALVWGLGSCLELTSKERYNEFLQDIIYDKDVIMKYKLPTDIPAPRIRVTLPENCNLFNIFYNKDKKQWVNWICTDSFSGCTHRTIFSDLIVLTTESARTRFILKSLLKGSTHLLLMGQEGVGKTTSVLTELNRSFTSLQYTYIRLSMSAKTSANQAQLIIESKLEKKGRKSQYGPLKGRKGVIFVDDLNMPQKDPFEVQPAIELLRQWMDYGGWYGIDNEHKFKSVVNVSFAGAITDFGRQSISERFMRHFNVLWIEQQDELTLKNMFQTLLDWKLANSSAAYAEEVKNISKNIVNATIEIYLLLRKEPDLQPIPSKAHYVFNLKDVSKVFQGICRSSAYAIRSTEDMIKLWAHECTRVFNDRLVNYSDCDTFMNILKEGMKKHFNKEWESFITSEPLLFGNFVPHLIVGPEGKEELVVGIYAEVTDKALLKTTIEEYIAKYKAESQRINLILFMHVMEHIIRLCRILTLPQGHALVVGTGGAGQKSLTALAAFIGKFHTFKVGRTGEQEFESWRADLRKLMTLTGIEKTPTVFFLGDEQMRNAQFSEDVNSLLTIGEVPNLYAKKGKNNELMAKLRENIQLHSKKSITSDDEALEILKEQSRKNLRMIILLNPTMNEFRQYLSKFPSIVKQTSIDWFLPWPQETLETVAQQYLNTEAEITEAEREGIIKVCIDMHERVILLAKEYENKTGFHYYITPTHYLELLELFKKLLVKRAELVKEIKLHEKGLEEMKSTEVLVTKMKAKLIEMAPKQKECNENATSLALSLSKKKVEVQEETKVVQRNEEMAEETKRIADELQAECQVNYDKALPELKEAEKAIKDIDPAAISTMQSLASPSEVLKPVAKALCILLGIKPKTTPNQEPDYWLPKKIFTHKNMKKLAEYDKENIPLAKVTELKKVTEAPGFESETISSASVEAETIARWIRALIKYDQVNRDVVPLKARLKEESEKAQAAQESLAKTKKELEEKKELFAQLKQQLDVAEIQKKKIMQEIDVTEKQVERARDLVDLLKNEGKRWQEHLNNLQDRHKNFLGDVIISSGMIAYLRAFPESYRNSFVKTWNDRLVVFGISKSDTFSLFDTLYDSMQLFIWKKQKLPTDNKSIENAIMMDNSDRWPLFIDPQMQAVNWIKTREKVEVIKSTHSNKYMLSRLIAAVTGGTSLLFEDIGEEINPALIPLIRKEISLISGRSTVRIGEEFIVYNKKFALYMATRLPQPYYSPEVCSSLAIINFAASEEALADQMLNIMIAKEEPTLQRNREEAIQRSMDIKQKLKKKEEEVLRMVTSKKEDILKSDQLLETLRNTKSECKKFMMQMEEQRKANDKIELARSQFQTVARRVAVLYFCIESLVKLENIYQYSLEWYTELYMKALEGSYDMEHKEKLKLYKSKFTYLLFSNISKSLLTKDKLPFTISLLLNIFVAEELNTPAEVKFLLGNYNVSTKAPDNKVTWLSDKAWKQIYELSQSFPAFKEFDTELINNSSEWEAIANSPKFVHPANRPWPNNWSSQRLNLLQQLIVINIMKPEKFIEAVQIVIANHLGKEYLEHPPLNIEEAYNSSTHKKPVLLILSQGADPLEELKNFLAKRHMVDELVLIPLGKGQDKVADLTLNRALAARETIWVVMQNCHLAKAYLSHLEKRLEEIPEEVKLPFRLWLTSMPTNNFPTTLLQNSIKLAHERPKGISKNMIEMYKKLDNDKFEVKKITRKLLFNLTMFHALIQERGKYGSLGWSYAYEFSYYDYEVAVKQLLAFVEKYEEVQWNALEYTITDLVYGGHIIDPFDLKRLKVIFSEFFNEGVLKDDYKLCGNKEYKLSINLNTKEEYIKHLTKLPLYDNPEIFGLNQSANTAYIMNDTNQIFAQLTALNFSTATISKEDKEQIGNKVNGLLEMLPKEFNIEEHSKANPEEPTKYENTVLMQELKKYNTLLKVVKESLSDLQKALKGQSLMVKSVEEVMISLLNNQVPETWKAYSYPTTETSLIWFENLKARMEFFREWMKKGTMDSYWISAFFFPSSFFTCILQNYSRTNSVPIDTLTIDCTIPTQDITEGYLIHGLFIEGAKWDIEKNCLGEGIRAEMPKLWVRPMAIANIPKDRYMLECPVYYEKREQGTMYQKALLITVDLPLNPEDAKEQWIKRVVFMTV